MGATHNVFSTADTSTRMASLGASLVVSAVGETGTDGELVYAVAVVLGGGSLALVGLAYIFRPGDFGLGPDGFPE